MTKPTKQRVLILFGGRSGEHEVSIVSATHVLRALDKKKYDVSLVGITKAGEWVQFPATEPLTALDDPDRSFTPALVTDRSNQLTFATATPVAEPIDVVLPILHGPYGEDGTIQGLLELSGLPYIGCGVLASAVAMDKGIAKELLCAAGLPVVTGITVQKTAIEADPTATALSVEQTVGRYPMFVKPANLGSSVGISKVKSREALAAALTLAAAYDRRVIVEPAVPNAREIEVAVLGNEQIEVSVPGEIVPDREFYDYDSKYGTDSSSEVIIPAKLPATKLREIEELAKRAYQAIDGAGMARVDFLLSDTTNELFVNEINTIPGFTPISMYTKLWQASGIEYGQLLDRLIALGSERATLKRSLRVSR